MLNFMLLGVAFVFGAVAILALEGVGILLVIRRLKRRLEDQEEEQRQKGHDGNTLTHHHPSFSHKQGIIWILESENAGKDWHTDTLPREQRRKMDILEIVPVQKHATVKDKSLFISELDGYRTEVKLRGCTVSAVSATSHSSRKWAKKYPIKVESKGSRLLYKGSKILYIYLDTSWEKESWCKALRLASCDDEEKLKWFANLNLEFRQYVGSLSTEYPSFMKPSVGLYVDPIDKSIKLDGSSSKVRQFLKRLAKKASKSGLESKTGGTSTVVNEERKYSDKSRPRDYGIANTALAGKLPENMTIPSSLSISSDLGSRSSAASDADSEEKLFGDEGTLCWNLLLSRLFFDAKRNGELKSSLKARIQKMLSDMRSPSYIGEITCTSVDPGNLPPYIHAMRVIPSQMDELWAFDVDIEYSGGAMLNIETRLEVQELDLQKREGEAFESNDVDEVTSDLLESFVHYENNLKNTEEKTDMQEKKEEGEADGIRSQKNTLRASSQVSRWKSLLHSVAKQFSQVPLSLRVRVSCIRGTIRLYIKPPPSDRIWFGFTSMPDLDFNLESFIGERKITNAHVALLVINRFKVSIRDALVLPNCESICIPWMLGEKEDWVPQSVAPLIWIKQDPGGSSNTRQGDEKLLGVEIGNRGIPKNNNSTEGSQRKQNEGKKEGLEECGGSSSYSSSGVVVGDGGGGGVDELRTPLLRIDEKGETSGGKRNPEWEGTSQAVIVGGGQHNNNNNNNNNNDDEMEEDDWRRKRMGTRARVLGFGKKMGEKLEEKRRHIEEKGRHIVERMRKDHSDQNG